MGTWREREEYDGYSRRRRGNFIGKLCDVLVVMDPYAYPRRDLM
jgi:hypothetical protein